jgi:ubiquitin-protein ligase
MLTFFTLP